MSPSHIYTTATLVTCLCLSTGAYGQLTDGPNSGNTVTNTTLVGAVASWSALSNAQSSDNSYAASTLSINGTTTNYLTISNFGFNIPLLSTILGIEVGFERFGDKIKDNQVRIIKTGVIRNTDKSSTTGWAGTDPDSYVTYGGNNDSWGESWVPLNINSSLFGVAISVKRDGAGIGAAIANIDHVRITVYYETFLPVGLVSFTTKSLSRSIDLHWETAWEEGNSHFEVQRSGSNLNFSTLGFLSGKNNSTDLVQYDFSDKAPLPGYNYYRLKQHDFNGTFTFSEVVKAKKSITPHKSVSPTLVDTGTTLRLEGSEFQEYNFYITDCQGKLIETFCPDKPDVFIPRSNFPKSGLYFYKLLYKGNVHDSGKLVVR